MNGNGRYSTGVTGLDALLGGGLLPGTLTVVVGATGIGKTQLGVQFAQAGLAQEGRRGILFDMTGRGDPQNHQAYARRMCNWPLEAVDPEAVLDLEHYFDTWQESGEYLHGFDYQGRKVTRDDLDFESWQAWKQALIARLDRTIAFFYGHLVRGVRRTVIDGIEPVDRPSDSIQFELFEYIYQQILRKECDWVARDLLRQHYRAQEKAVEAHRYDANQVACLLLYTSHESLLEQLISRPLDQGDLLANANTVILLGKVREGNRLSRALYVAKHRGSACRDDIVPYSIGDSGLRVGA